jgi:hypothetical protein
MLPNFSFLLNHLGLFQRPDFVPRPSITGIYWYARRGHRLMAAAVLICSTFSGAIQAQQKPESSPEPKTEKRSNSTWPEKLGPAEIESEVGAVRLGFYAQLLATESSRDKGEDQDRDNSFEVEPRRIRWQLKSRFLEDRLRVELQINTVPKSIELLDYWGEWRIVEHLQMRLGQYKEPFTRYRQQSFSSSLLADWAIAPWYFGADRQMGLMFHNRGARPRFEYALAIFSGQNMRKAQAVETANTVYGEKIVSRSSLPRDSGLSIDEWHPELELRIQHNSPDADPYNPSDNKRTAFRHVESLSIAWDNVNNLNTLSGQEVDRAVDQAATRDMMLRFSPEVLLKAYGFALVANFYLGVARMTQRSDNELAMLGYLVETAYRFDRFWEIAARFTRIDFTKALRDDASDRAQAIITAAEQDPDAQATLVDQYRNAGLVKTHQEVTLGFNVYIVGTDLKWQTDASWLRKYRDNSDGESDNRDDFRARTQMQFGF